MRRAFAVLGNLAAMVLLLLWLLLASLMLVLSPPVTHFLAENTVDVQHSQLSQDYLVGVADAARSYCAGLDVDLPVGDDQRVAFTAEVMGHLDDVRQVFVLCQWAAVVTTLLLLAGSIITIMALRKARPSLAPLAAQSFARRQLARRCARILRLGALGALLLTVLLAIIGALNFDALFTALHRLFFAEGSWLFAYDSLLICALPEAFWMGCAVVWAAALLLLCALILLVSGWLGSARRFARESAPAEAG